MNYQFNPIAAWKKVFASKKLLFISLFFSITVIAAVWLAFENKLDLTKFNIAGIEIKVADLLGEQIAGILSGISNILLIFSLLALLPQVLTAIALWLIKSGAGYGTEATKRANYGLTFIKIRLFLNLIGKVLSLVACIFFMVFIFL